MTKPTCTMPECGREHVAKGMCKMHYYRVNRKPEPIRYIPRTCTDCGVDYQGSRGALTTTCPPCAKVNAIAKRMVTLAAKRAEREASAVPKPKPTHKKSCTRCGVEYEAQNMGSKYCSEFCSKEYAAERVGSRNRGCRDCGVSLGYYSLVSLCDPCRKTRNRQAQKVGRHRRRARIYGAVHESIKPIEIYERDGWKCGLCGHRINRERAYPHPRSATLDHIVPLAHGGTHTRVNVQLACWSCNHKKGAKMNGQPLLFG